MDSWFTVEQIDCNTLLSANISIGKKRIVIFYVERKEPF